MPNPKLKDQKLDEFLNDLCIKNLNDLMDVNLIEKCDFLNDKNAEIKPTPNAHLMAKYCIAYETIKLFLAELGFHHPKKSADNDENSNLDNSFEEDDQKPLAQESKTLEDLVCLILYFKLAWFMLNFCFFRLTSFHQAKNMRISSLELTKNQF